MVGVRRSLSERLDADVGVVVGLARDGIVPARDQHIPLGPVHLQSPERHRGEKHATVQASVLAHERDAVAPAEVQRRGVVGMPALLALLGQQVERFVALQNQVVYVSATPTSYELEQSADRVTERTRGLSRPASPC